MRQARTREYIIVLVLCGLLFVLVMFAMWRSALSHNLPTPTYGKILTSGPYAGWKVYCDTTHHYCFRYPADWTADTSNHGGFGDAQLQNPSKTLSVTYANTSTYQSGPTAFTPVYVNQISAANQGLTIVGGYSPNSLQPHDLIVDYRVVDSSLLTRYPLTVGEPGEFPYDSSFTNQGDSHKSTGQFFVEPAVPLYTNSDAEAWLNGDDAKTSVKILQSFHYQK